MTWGSGKFIFTKLMTFYSLPIKGTLHGYREEIVIRRETLH